MRSVVDAVLESWDGATNNAKGASAVVGIVLGVSMATTNVRMVLVEGENADGVTVDQDDLDVAADSSASAATQVILAILGTREGAAEAGFQLLSTGVTFTDPVQAAVLRDALIAYKVENVMLVSAFMAAAALAQAVGDATNYAQTALLFVEPYSELWLWSTAPTGQSRRCVDNSCPTTRTARWPDSSTWSPPPIRWKPTPTVWSSWVPASTSR